MPTFQSVVRSGAIVAVAVTLILFAATGWYLLRYMSSTNQSVDELSTKLIESGTKTDSQVHAFLLTRFAMARIAFNSCGLAVGLAMGFLSIALFLFGVQDSMNVQAENNAAKLNISQMSAGGFAILCASVIIITCVLAKPSLELSENGNPGRVNTQTPATQ